MIRIECPSGHSKDAKITDTKTGEDLTARYCIRRFELSAMQDGRDGWNRALVEVRREPVALDVATIAEVRDEVHEHRQFLARLVSNPLASAEDRERLERIIELLGRAYPPMP